MRQDLVLSKFSFCILSGAFLIFFKGCLTFQAAHKKQTLCVPKLKLLPHLLQQSQVR